MNYKTISVAIIGTVLVILSSLASANSIVHSNYSKGDFVLFNPRLDVPDVVLDSTDPVGVKIAWQSIQQDLLKVSGKQPQLLTSLPSKADRLIIVGSVFSATVQALVESGKIDISSIEGQWEGYQIQVVDKPFANVDQALVIVGSDKRGTIFGSYQLTRDLGVSPWYWWADVPVKSLEQSYVAGEKVWQEQPKVKYRGIFLNDEAPALTGWVREKYGNYNAAFYQHVFELILRLKGNYMWPAMWNNAFAMDDPKNVDLADQMGIVMGTSHHEPMMRADKEWNWTGGGKWDYSVNAENLYRFWEEGAERYKDKEGIFTLGMRGQQDEPMSEHENIGLLEEIVADQRKILTKQFGEDLTKIPQVWALYKEVQGYYENGMRVPDDVTLLWSDDNWGNVRRLPTAEERTRSGGAGVYYHFDYVGGPRSYRWINVTPVAKIWEQMSLAWRYQADRIWIVNVGDLKPMELPTSFFLDMAWNPMEMTATKMSTYAEDWSAEQFGPEHAQTIAELLDGYTRQNGRRKPELMDVDSYSLVNYREADRVSEELLSLANKAKALANEISPAYQDAYFQLVEHPVLAVQNLFELYRHVGLNRLYAGQGRASTNQFAEKAKQLFRQDQALTDKYHSIGDGRWNYFMSQPHIGYTYWNNPPANMMPAVAYTLPPQTADMGIAPEGSVLAWPNEKAGRMSLEPFSPYGQQQKYLDMFNRGSEPYNFKITASEPWIKVSETSGEIGAEDKRIWVSIDWQALEPGKHSGQLRIKGTGWGTAGVAVTAVKPSEKPHGFTYADGAVSVLASQAIIVDPDEQDLFSWQDVPKFGRFAQAKTAVAPANQRIEVWQKAPYLSWDIYLFEPGQYEFTMQVAPTLKFDPDWGLRFGVGLNDDEPMTVELLKNDHHRVWQAAVRAGVRTVTVPLTVTEEGPQVLKVYMTDPGVTVEKLWLSKGGAKPSYLGPPPSQYFPVKNR